MTYKTYKVTVYDSGRKDWYQHGKLHREDGPAVEHADGHNEWYINGRRHRGDGPAIEYASGSKYWYLDDKPLSEQKFNQRMSKIASCDGKTVEIDGKEYKLQEI